MKPSKHLLSPAPSKSVSLEPSPILPTIITNTPVDEVPEEEQEFEEDGNGAISVCRVFCKFREWGKKSPSESSEEAILPLLTKIKELSEKKKKRKKKRRRKRPQIPKDSKTSKEELVLPQLLLLPCSVCKEEIDIDEIFLHKKQHEALATLGFQWMDKTKPQPVIVALKRQFIISKLFSSFMLTEQLLQSINNATELLFNKKVSGHFKMCDDVGKSSVYSQKNSHLLIKGVATCEDRNSSWRSDMNDKFTIVNDFGNKPNVCFFGLFDGHHGVYSADLASKELPILILHQLSKIDASYQMSLEQQKFIHSFHTVFREEYITLEERFSSSHSMRRTEKHAYENIHKAFAKAFWRMDRLLRLGRNEVSHVRWSGCSALICLLEGTIKNSPASKSRKRSKSPEASSILPPVTPNIISGVLHVANIGNVQAVLCRNGKGFCVTKEHTTQNINERTRVLESGAIISPDEPYGLLEGQVKTTRGFGFHGNLHLKKFLIPAPQTISVPIDDLCQFLVLATNGLWEALDKKEVTSLIITLFQRYTEAYHFFTQIKSSPSKQCQLRPISDTNMTKSESTIHVLFQNKQESKEHVSVTNTNRNKNSGSKFAEYHSSSPKNEGTLPSEMTNHELFREEETDRPNIVDSVQVSRNESHAKDFYEGAAEYVSRELVKAALQAGSRDNITVTLIFLNGSEHPLLP
ncbi:protein phosphatase 2C-like domain-containing protein 1 [Perognathus longimembris pacificus]|uniref:protein phosphatase 2C-like domain-containing protein 1 n=1 Tax=Perognathus longimembris pacificus TaxID=214514 RepID=UPI0020199F9C|nr:protein phosphatase 2C-like domain-containing protein 1 [Perognathus longimembris pacificus]